MFVILTYDVNQKRVAMVLKTCRKYLFHVQNSVFEGTITEAKLRQLKEDLESKIDKKSDQICLYEFDSTKYSRREQIGATEDISNVID